jgi:hypothetical protein
MDVKWKPTEDRIIYYLSWEAKNAGCELATLAHDCGFLRNRTKRQIDSRYETLAKSGALRKRPRWTEWQTKRLLQEWGDRACTLSVAIDTAREISDPRFTHPPEALMCRVAATRWRARQLKPREGEHCPPDGRALIRFLRSPKYFGWLESGQRRQALSLAAQGGKAVFVYLDLCKTPLTGRCK